MEHVAFAELLHENRADLADGIVASLVTKPVIQRLEVVGIGEALNGQQRTFILRVNVCRLVAHADDGTPAYLAGFAVEFQKVLVFLLVLLVKNLLAILITTILTLLLEIIMNLTLTI